MTMNRAARRREQKGLPPLLPKAKTQEIKLQSPNSHNHRAFILGNAQFCDHVVEENSHAGQHLVLCGAGPSLAENADEWCHQGDQVWGCNSALTWLSDHGHKVTHGFTVDQQPEMCAEWYSAPDVEYMVASTIHPHLTEYLMSKGRRLRWFHNFVGIQERNVTGVDEHGVTHNLTYEDWVYSAIYPATVRAGSGLNAVTRAIDVARYMGFAKITVLGADCALRLKSRPDPTLEFGSPAYMDWLRNETVMHADGGSALASNATPVTLGGEIDPGTTDTEIRPGHGEWWESKPDLLISAVWLEQMRRTMPDVLNIVGHVLPNALRLKDAAYLSLLPKMVSGSGEDINYVDAVEA
jgi:hypothetical protein